MGAPYMFKAIFTTSIARTTPAQKPRGRNKIIFFPAADIGVGIGVPIITIQLQTFGKLLKKGEDYAVPLCKLLTSRTNLGVDRAVCPLFQQPHHAIRNPSGSRIPRSSSALPPGPSPLPCAGR